MSRSRLFRQNRLFFGMVVLLFILHVLVLCGVLAPSFLWDSTIYDSGGKIAAECFTLIFLGSLLWLYRAALPRLGRAKPRKSCLMIQRVLLIYFILELAGSLAGTNVVYRIFGVLFYGLCLIIGVNSARSLQRYTTAIN